MMEHNDLVVQGFVDDIDGNESYAVNYMKGVLFSNDITSLRNINGSEGLFQTIWEKIKQFFKWFIGLFTSKKDVGVATKEVGVKKGLPKATKVIIKVTPVKVEDIKPADPAPKAHAPTPEQKTKDKVEMKVVEIKEPEKVTAPKVVELVTVPHNLNSLYSRLKKIADHYMAGLRSLEKDYTDLHSMFEKIEMPQRGSLTHRLRIQEVNKYVGRWGDITRMFSPFLKENPNFSNITEHYLNGFADNELTTICYKMEHVIDENKITQIAILGKTPPSESEFLEEFKKLLDRYDNEEFSNQVAKIAVKALRLDFNSEMMLEVSDKLSQIKREILSGNYFVRAPRG